MSNHKDPLEMMTLIGVRCTRGNTFSRDVLIDQAFLSSDGGREGGLESRNNLLFTLSEVEGFVWTLCFGGLTAGPHPFSFRTRKLSSLVAMVLAFTGRESS